MNHDPSIDPKGRDDLQELFDATAQEPSDEQCARMLAHAKSAPARLGRAAKRGSSQRFWIPFAAAAAIAATVGGAVWLSHREPDVSTVATPMPSANEGVSAPPEVSAPVAVASTDAPDDVEESLHAEDSVAALGTDWDDGDWMSELDLLHDPVDVDETTYWATMEQLLEDDG